jgi:type VI secretion system secreted protein VgrG
VAASATTSSSRSAPTSTSRSAKTTARRSPRPSPSTSARATSSASATQTTTVGKDRQLDVEGDASERVGGDLVVEATNATTSTSETIKFEAGEGFIVTAKDDIDVDGEAKIVVEAKKKMVFKCGDASITLKQDGKILIKGKDVTVKGSGNVLIKGQKVAEN